MAQTFEINGAPLELLDVNELALIHANNKPFDTWLLDKFFPNRKSFNLDVVPIAELDIQSDIAPLVAPHLHGQAFDPKSAVAVNFVKPAYLKPKNQVTPATSFDSALVARLRDTGIISTGSNQLTEQDKYVIAQIEVMKRNRDSIDNHKILQACDLFTSGQIVLESKDYQQNIVSYGRDASLKFTPTTPWNTDGATPVSDIELMLERILDANGGEVKYAVMSGKVWAALEKNAEFKAKFITPYAGIAVPIRPDFVASRTAKFRGHMSDIEVWTYDATYRTDGITKRFIPADFFALVADDQGYVTHCKIKNVKAGGQAMDYFEDQWYENDPSGIMVLSESAPLIVPSNKNGICGGTGFIKL